jgi:hypothetical protein
VERFQRLNQRELATDWMDVRREDLSQAMVKFEDV